MHDLRSAFRQLIKSPGFTVVAVLTLALGIGAITAIFSVVNAVLLKPLPYRDAGHLFVLSITHEQLGPEGSTLSPADVFDFKAQNHLFDFSAFADNVFNVSGGKLPEQVPGAYVTAQFFSTLGVTPLLGRSFLPDEEKPGAAAVVVISEGFWRSHFQADPQVIGRSLTLNSRPSTIVGVAPASLRLPDQSMQLWVAYQLEQPTQRGPYYLHGLVRSSGSLADARSELARMASRIKATTPGLPASYGFIATPLNDWLLGRVRPALLVLLGAVGLVLLIAALNVANLLLSRAAAREKEISIRAALGASRVRIVRQLLTENLVLALAGGTAGLLLSFWGVDLLRTFGPQDVPRLQEVAVDRPVLGWTFLISLGSGLLFGLAPAWHGARLDMNRSLKEGGRGSTESAAARRLRGLFVAVEMALALMLLIGAGLLIRSFVQLQEVRSGINAEQAMTMQVPLSWVKYPEDAQIVNFYDRLLAGVKSAPGIRSVALGDSLPPNGLQISDTFNLEGRLILPEEKSPLASVPTIGPGFFRTLGVPILRGRDFTERDDARATQVVIINQTLARKYFGQQDPIGKRLKGGGVERTRNPWMEIIGVVGDVKYEGLDVSNAPAYYLPFRQWPQGGMNLVVSAAIAPAAVVQTVRDEVRKLDPEVPVARVNTMENLIVKSVAQPRFRTFLIGAFSAVAMLLAAIGIYGVLAYSVAQRTREIGIRMALGAQRGDVLGLVVRQGMMPALLGLAAGLLGAMAMTRFMASLLFQVSTVDPVVFAGVALVLALVAAVACLVPARRATLVNPMEALHNE